MQRLAVPPWLAAVVVLVLGALACALVWHQQRSTTHTLAQERFERQAQMWASQLQQHLAALGDVLYGMDNLFVLNPHLRRSDFERAAGHLDRVGLLPGVRNLHFTRMVPAEQRAEFEGQTRRDPHLDGSLPQRFAVHPVPDEAEHYVVDFVWPLNSNISVMGLNVRSQPSNMQAIERMRRTRTLTATAPFDLRQEQGQQRSGVVLRLPVWHKDEGGA